MKRNTIPEMCKGFLNKRYCVLQDVLIRSKISSKLVIIYNGHASDKISYVSKGGERGVCPPSEPSQSSPSSHPEGGQNWENF